jgi:hypothetical protein
MAERRGGKVDSANANGGRGREGSGIGRESGRAGLLLCVIRPAGARSDFSGKVNGPSKANFSWADNGNNRGFRFEMEFLLSVSLNYCFDFLLTSKLDAPIH